MEQRDFDVVVIGAGGAGVAAAVAAADLGARVAVVAKEPVGYGNTRVAMGALAHGRLSPDDSPELFYNDMIQGGEGLNNPRLARIIVDEAPDGVRLVERYGHVFNRDAEGRLNLSVASKAGGHSVPRTVRSASIGIGIGHAMRAAVSRAGVEILEEVLVSKLLVQDKKILGLVGLRLADGETLLVRAGAVILATGGAGWLYAPHTSCVRASTGDGYALALEAGAQLIDMEQVQCIPFSVCYPEAYVGIMLGEPSVAGRGGRLFNIHGEVVLSGIGPMTRAQVTRAMAEELEKGNGTARGGLFLDFTLNFEGPRGEENRKRLMTGETAELVRQAYGLKAWRCEEPWEVSPSVHFFMGGVATDEWGKSSVDGLYAAGEVAGGVHGANRLGSVALTEIFVMGKRAGEHAARAVKTARAAKPSQVDLAGREDAIAALRGAKGEHRPVSLVTKLQKTMWDKVGIARSEERCREALETIESLEADWQDMAISPCLRFNGELADAVELRLMLKAARAITLAALVRTESRGAHFRLDYPNLDAPQGKFNTLVRMESSRLQADFRPVPTA